MAQPTVAGVARCVADYAADQVRRGWTVTVLSPAESPLVDWLADAGVSHREWAATRDPGPSVLGEMRRLAALLTDCDPDVVHLHSAKAGLAGRLALRDPRRTVFQPHAWSFDAVGGTTARMALLWERWATRWAGVVVCVSEAERRAGEAAGLRARWEVVPNGVDLDQFSAADDAERQAARARLGLDADPLAVCVGRLCRQKGQDVAIAAWPAVRAAVPDAQLVLVGDGPDSAPLAAAAGPGVTLAGARDDVADWLAAADVVVAPSRWEAMSLGVLEALARARSVVASEVSGMAESVPPGGGRLVAPEDPAALASAVSERLTDPALAHREGEVGRAHVTAHHRLSLSCDGIVAAYDSLVAGSAR